MDKKGIMQPLGVEGVRVSNGFVHDEFLQKLVGDRGRKTYRQMRDNDATIGAIMFAIEMLLRNVPWSVAVDAPEGTPEEQIEGVKNYLESIMDDMSITWSEFLGNVLTMLTFGWQYTEVVYKRRIGPDQKDPTRRSKYTDGLVGVRKLADRSQETLNRWELDEEDGGVLGMWQDPPNGGQVRFIPIERALLFRPHAFKGSPEGRSVLRSVYKAWYLLKNIQEFESMAIERELNGLPVLYAPDYIVNPAPDDTAGQAAKAKCLSLIRDVKLNDQGGVLLPSDLWKDAEGNPSSSQKMRLELIASNGTRAIDTDKVVRRYQTDIARCVLADFIMLGQSERGGWALSRSKTDLFAAALSGWLGAIAEVLNRFLVPKLWALNAFDQNVMARFVPGKVAPEDLTEISDFIDKLARAGFTIAPDDELENHLRTVAGLPEKQIIAEDEI